MIRYGLIGSGMMGQEHIRNIQLLEGTRISAVADPDQSMRELSASNCREQPLLFGSHTDLLDADVCDAFVIVSPNDTHYEILQDVIPVGKPVLCEKPLCTTVEHCERVVELAHIHHSQVWVAMEYRYMPPVQKLLQEIGKGTTGPVQMLSIREHRFPFLPKVGDWNRFNRRTGGTLTEKCCHFWDLMRLVLDSDPVRVYASGAMDVNHVDERYDGRTPDIIDNAYVIVDFENGTRAMLDLCMFAEGSYWQEVISATGPNARVDAMVPGPARFNPDGKERHARLEISWRESKTQTGSEVLVDESILQAGDHHGSTFFQHQRFLELVRGDRSKPEVDLQDGLWSVRVGEAAELSVRLGKAVDIRR